MTPDANAIVLNGETGAFTRAEWLTAFVVGAGMFLLCVLLRAEFNGSDCAFYVDTARRMADGDSSLTWIDRAGRTTLIAPTALLMSLFGWAKWSWVVYPALCAGTTAGCIALFVRRFVSSSPLWIAGLLPFTLSGLVKAGATLAPDAPLAAFLSLGMLLLFRSHYRLPGIKACVSCGVLWAFMVSINFSAFLFGGASVFAGIWWWSKLRNRRRDVAMVFVYAFAGFILGTMFMAAIQFWLHDDPLLVWRRLADMWTKVGGSGVEQGEQVAFPTDGKRAVGMWLKGVFSPGGEFGLTVLLCYLGALLSRRKVKSAGYAMSLLWYGTVVGGMALYLVPVLLDQNVFGAGELSSRYVIPASVPVAILAAAALSWTTRRWIQVGVVCCMLMASLANISVNHKPANLIVTADELLDEYRDVESVSATKRLASTLSWKWGREVNRIESVQSEGIVILSMSENAMVKRKYGLSAYTLPEGFELGPVIKSVEHEPTTWNQIGNFVRSVKNFLLQRKPSQVSSQVIFEVRNIRRVKEELK